MANRVTIYIHNQSYNFLAEEDASYLQQCADIVNKEMDEAMSGTTISLTDGAVLAAMNVADKYCKERAVSDNLRAQLKQALDENARLARELSEAKREGRKASRGGRPQAAPGRAFQARRRRGITHGAAGPAGSPEALQAAVQAGADAVYLGFGPSTPGGTRKTSPGSNWRRGWPTATSGGEGLPHPEHPPL